MSRKYILAIESSCDETSSAVIQGEFDGKSLNFEVLSNVIHSQIEIHKKWGGVVPEIAAREHVKAIKPVVEKALEGAKITLDELECLAVTSGPGLIGSLLVGVEFTKGLASAIHKPVLAINHMEGHLCSAFACTDSRGKIIQEDKVEFPLVSLVVSGGHSMLVLMENELKYKVLGSTLDDAAGEAFDKVAKLMGIPYPGGPAISKMAEEFVKSGKEKNSSLKFPRPLMHADNFDLSFSGLKTAVRYALEKLPKDMNLQTKQEIAWAFQEAVVEVLTIKTVRAAREFSAKSVSLTGGVSANKRLRDILRQEIPSECIFLAPPTSLCTDNAGMIAISAYLQLRMGKSPKKPEDICADSNWEIF